MKYISPLLSDARNKLGGSVFARNRAGVYARARVSPTQPRTVSQQANRAGFTAIASAWKTLTQTQRLGWNAAAPSITLQDTLGASYRPSGFQLFVSCNRNAAIFGSALIEAFPGKPNLTNTFRLRAVTAVTLYTGWDNLTADWDTDATAGDYYVALYSTPCYSAGISFVNPAQYRFTTTENLELGTIDFSSQWTDLYGGYGVVGEQIAIKMRVIHLASGFELCSQTMSTFVHD